jgi:hypothetical protein
MSRLNNDLKAVMDDAFSQGEKLLKELIPVLVDDDLDEDEKMQKLSASLEQAKPKTYDDYIHDIKQAFRNDGWIEPEATPTTESEQVS